MDTYTTLRPARQSKRFRRFQEKGSNIGYKLLADQAKAGVFGDNSSKDILSVLSKC
jgi:hypothetical protein